MRFASFDRDRTRQEEMSSLAMCISYGGLAPQSPNI
jgi:hypothetical protein